MYIQQTIYHQRLPKRIVNQKTCGFFSWRPWCLLNSKIQIIQFVLLRETGPISGCYRLACLEQFAHLPPPDKKKHGGNKDSSPKTDDIAPARKLVFQPKQYSALQRISITFSMQTKHHLLSTPFQTIRFLSLCCCFLGFLHFRFPAAGDTQSPTALCQTARTARTHLWRTHLCRRFLWQP